MKTREEFGKFLKEKREEAGVTQATLSKTFGHTTPQFISNIERGIAPLPIALIRRWATKIKLNPHDILAARSNVMLAEQTLKFKGIRK